MVFLSLGLGMAAPYVLLSVWTGLLKWIPKPGRWMDDLKRVMGFLLFGFALYLMIGLPQYMILTTCGLCLSVAFGILLYFRFAPLGSPLKKKLIIGLWTLLATFAGGYASFMLLSGPGEQEKTLESEGVVTNRWEAFTPEKLLNAHARGQHVMIDFTASWCMNCQYNKLTVYYSKEVTDLIFKKNILALKADLTNSNPAAESLLQHLGSRSIPFFAIFPGDDPYKPVIIRDIVKKKDVVRMLSQLAER
jgi:thiol:disulfide interchange protein